MRVIGRLLETALVVTYILGMWAAARRARRAQHRVSQRRLLEYHGPRRDTFASGYVGATGWDGYVVPPPSPEEGSDERAAKRVYRRRRHASNVELQRHERRRLARVARTRASR